MTIIRLCFLISTEITTISTTMNAKAERPTLKIPVNDERQGNAKVKLKNFRRMQTVNQTVTFFDILFSSASTISISFFSMFIFQLPILVNNLSF